MRNAKKLDVIRQAFLKEGLEISLRTLICGQWVNKTTHQLYLYKL
jgi:hypothetical protein